MNGQALAELLRRELFNEEEGDRYRLGWNDRSRALLALVVLVEPRAAMDLGLKDELVKGRG